MHSFCHTQAYPVLFSSPIQVKVLQTILPRRDVFVRGSRCYTVYNFDQVWAHLWEQLFPVMLTELEVLFAAGDILVNSTDDDWKRITCLVHSCWEPFCPHNWLFRLPFSYLYSILSFSQCNSSCLHLWQMVLVASLHRSYSSRSTITVPSCLGFPKLSILLQTTQVLSTVPCSGTCLWWFVHGTHL